MFGIKRTNIFWEERSRKVDETSSAGSATLKDAVEFDFEGMDSWREEISS